METPQKLVLHRIPNEIEWTFFRLSYSCGPIYIFVSEILDANTVDFFPFVHLLMNAFVYIRNFNFLIAHDE